MTEQELRDLVAAANERFNALTPDQQAEHRAAQRESYVRAELSWPKPRFKMVDGVKVYDSYEDYCA